MVAAFLLFGCVKGDGYGTEEGEKVGRRSEEQGVGGVIAERSDNGRKEVVERLRRE